MAAATRLMEGAVNDIDRACLLASRSKESGARLQALPISAMGLWLEDNFLRIVFGICWHPFMLLPLLPTFWKLGGYYGQAWA